MGKVVIAGSLAIIMVLSIGCATKSYVRKQATPILDKMNDLDQRTAENSKEIKEVDARPRRHTGGKCQQSRIGAENRSRRQCVVTGKPTGQCGEQQVYVVGEHHFQPR